MKDINYANCMKRRCEQCKNYDYCFRYRPGGKKNNEIQNKWKHLGDINNIKYRNR